MEKEKAERAELQGEFRSVMNQLKEDFDVNDLDQADERIKEAEESLKAMNKSIRDKIEELEEMMGRHG